MQKVGNLSVFLRFGKPHLEKNAKEAIPTDLNAEFCS
jgi:hypothetical protein